MLTHVLIFIQYIGIFTAHINKVIQTILLVLSSQEVNKE